jgi:hypothetical protein
VSTPGHLTIPISEIVGLIREAARVQLNDYRNAGSKLAAASINVEQLIENIARNAAQRLHGVSIEELAEQNEPTVNEDTISDDQIKVLSMLGDIGLDTACVAIGLRQPQRGDHPKAARRRCAVVWNMNLRARRPL